MWRPRGAVPAFLALALPAALACGGGDGTGPGGGDVEPGRFTARISGSFTQTLSGQAFYFQGAEEGFTISMSNEGSSGNGVVLARGNPDLPEVGEYQVIDGTTDPLPPDDFIASSFLGNAGGLILCFSGDLDEPQGVGGTLNITASGSNVVGDFTTDVGCLDPSNGQVKAATITGEFNAEAGPTE